MADRFPGYDVLAKRDGPSWNAATRAVISARRALRADPHVLGIARTATLEAVADRIAPQPAEREPVNTAAMVIDRIARNAGDGYRPEGLPPLRDAWIIGLDAIAAEAQARHGRPFAELTGSEADALLHAIENGSAASPAWGDLPPRLFWAWRLLPDIVGAYCAHPSVWSAMGFGGPAAPRGYVRMEADRRDGWEAAEIGDGRWPPAATRNRHVR
jgi:hypothetical protein